MSAVYLDNCATTRVCEEAARKALDAMTEHYGNPSSLHTMGVDAESLLRQARERIASLLGCGAGEILFTSGGTESNNLAVFGAAQARRRRGKRIVTTMIEHSSVEGPMARLEKEGFEVVRLRPGPDGSIRAEDLMQAVSGDTILVSLMLVNNETGAVQPIEAARRAVEAAGAPALIHCDAVQAFGKMRVSPRKLGVDLMSLSAHKIHAPKGAGALYVSKGARILPVCEGGGQEKGLRPGTEPVPSIAAFGEAAAVIEAHFTEYTNYIRELRAGCLERLAPLPFITVNSPAGGAPHVLNVSVEGVRSETMLHFLAMREIYVSSGSACSRGARSRVLTAMGLPAARVDSALRVSFSRYNTREDIVRLADALAEGARSLIHAR